MNYLLAIPLALAITAQAETIQYGPQRGAVLDCSTDPIELGGYDSAPILEVPEAYGELTCESLDTEMSIGALTVEADQSNIIETLSFESELCLPCEATETFRCIRQCWVFADYAQTVGYSPDGTEYIVRSLLNGSTYPIRFIRRAPTDFDDPVTIMQLQFWNARRAGQATLIYEYEE